MTRRRSITDRPLCGWTDVLAVREFLIDIYAETGLTGRTWETRRWEGRFWHDEPDAVAARLASPDGDIRIWESDGTIVGVAHPESPGEAHLQTRPHDAALEGEMLEWAETVLPVTDDRSQRSLTSFAVAEDGERRSLFRSRGYERQPWHLVQRWRTLDDDLPRPAPGTGYGLRSLRAGDNRDASALAGVINAAFGHSFGAEELLNFEHAPSFVADLQIVAVNDQDRIVAHAGVNLDRRNRLAIVEPVCTHPDHRRAGLARACMAEGLARAKAAGATDATVSTGHDNPSNRIYEQLGFDEVEVVEAWTKTWAEDGEPSGSPR